MAFSKRRLAAQKVVAVVVFIALAANQWKFFVSFHSLDSFRQSEYDRPQTHHSKRYNTTTNANDREDRLQKPEIVFVNEIIHRAFFGLGHRLHRSAAAYHLARSLSLSESQSFPIDHFDDHVSLDQLQHQPVITQFRFQWESCLPSGKTGNLSLAHEKEDEKIEYNVFRYLFGNDVWELDYDDDTLLVSHRYPMATNDSDSDNSTISDIKLQIRRNMIVVRNDISGYIAGQLYKDLQLPLNYNPDDVFSRTNETKPFVPSSTASFNQRHAYDAILDKVMKSDVDFYHRLMDNYRFESELQQFQIKHKWNERPLVIGLHLRAGNGEGHHFTQSGRASSFDINEATMIDRLVRLIKMAVIRETKRLSDRKTYPKKQRRDDEQNDDLRPLLFIATDTAHLLPLIDEAINLGAMNESSIHYDHSRSMRENSDAPNITMTSPRPVSLEVVTWPQDRLPKNAGVTFDALEGQGQRCLDGWKAAVSDALLLSKVDVLVAAKRSTFTQSLPVTVGFDRNRKKGQADSASDTVSSPAKDQIDLNKNSQKLREEVIEDNRRFSFCEVSEIDVSNMFCYADARTWLFRGEDNRNVSSDEYNDANNPKRDERIWSFSIPGTDNGHSEPKEAHRQVEHRLTVLLPDVDLPFEFELAQDFLVRTNRLENNFVGPKLTDGDIEMYESTLHYGRSKINQKYRGAHKVVSTANNSWNLTYNTN